MKKRILAVVLTAALCIVASVTALANSPTSSSSSSKGGGGGGGSSAVTEATKGNVNTDSVNVAVVAADGTVSRVNLTKYAGQVNNAVVSVATSAAGSGNPGEAVSSIMTTPASGLFKATINALNGNIRIAYAGGYKVRGTAPMADGKKLASVGAVKGITKYAFVILTSVNADGSVEIVEGMVDPVTLDITGAFSGTPSTITVSVILAK